jgi:hypothetical protein
MFMNDFALERSPGPATSSGEAEAAGGRAGRAAEKGTGGAVLHLIFSCLFGKTRHI